MRGALALPALAALLLATPPAAAAPRNVVVVIDQLKYGPVPVLHVGDSITWINRDMFQHTATARDGSFNLDLRAGAKGRTSVRKAGVVRFACRYHPGMTGVLRVTPR